jgi:hypothetical protein
MKVTVTMFDGKEGEYSVNEVVVRDEPNRLILHNDNWRTRFIIPFESLVFWKEED